MKESEKFDFIINPKSPDSRWGALNFNRELIAEGKTPEEAEENAKLLTDKFSLMFLHKPGVYIFTDDL